MGLPETLRSALPLSKLLWLWLRSQRAPCYSVRALEARLGLAHRSAEHPEGTVYEGLRRLSELGRLERKGQRLKVK